VITGDLCLAIGVLATVLRAGHHQDQEAPFECGSADTRPRHQRHSVILLVALLFIVFDIESVFIYPGRVLRDCSARTGLVRLFRDCSFMATSPSARKSGARARWSSARDETPHRLLVSSPDGNVPESPRLGGEEQNIPSWSTRLGESNRVLRREPLQRARLGAQTIFPVPKKRSSPPAAGME